MTSRPYRGRVSVNLPGCYATYRQVPGSRVLRIDEWQLDDEPQQISRARMHRILETAKCGVPRWSLKDLAWAVEDVRRQIVVATKIQAELRKRRAEQARESRAVGNAVATLRRHLLSKIERWQRERESPPAGAPASDLVSLVARMRALGLSSAEIARRLNRLQVRTPRQIGGLIGDSKVTKARAQLAALERIPGFEPPLRPEEPWHEAARWLAWIYRQNFEARNEPPSWYWKGRGIEFVGSALKEIGCRYRAPDAIRQVIRHTGPQFGDILLLTRDRVPEMFGNSDVVHQNSLAHCKSPR